jgi:regulator of protease activity HflC (stomatin/prohibitin superfamily)
VLDPTRVATEGKVDEANNDQNLAEAQTKIQETLKARLRAAFGDDYFENVRVQNLRVRFEPDVQAQITQAQAKRAEVAKAKLEADRQVEVAEGQRRAAKELAEARIEAKRGYDNNPVQADIDKIKAFCGDDGCDPKVVGGGDVITSITGGK